MDTYTHSGSLTGFRTGALEWKDLKLGLKLALGLEMEGKYYYSQNGSIPTQVINLWRKGCVKIGYSLLKP